MQNDAAGQLGCAACTCECREPTCSMPSWMIRRRLPVAMPLPVHDWTQTHRSTSSIGPVRHMPDGVAPWCEGRRCNRTCCGACRTAARHHAQVDALLRWPALTAAIYLGSWTLRLMAAMGWLYAQLACRRHADRTLGARLCSPAPAECRKPRMPRSSAPPCPRRRCPAAVASASSCAQSGPWIARPAAATGWPRWRSSAA